LAESKKWITPRPLWIARECAVIDKSCASCRELLCKKVKPVFLMLVMSP